MAFEDDVQVSVFYSSNNIVIETLLFMVLILGSICKSLVEKLLRISFGIGVSKI